MQGSPTAARFATVRRCMKRMKKRADKGRKGVEMNIKTWYPSSPPVHQIVQRTSHVDESYHPFHFLSQNYHRRFRDYRLGCHRVRMYGSGSSGGEELLENYW